MTQISQLVSHNPSGAWDRVSRRQCYAGAKRLGINVKPGAKHSEMVSLLTGQGITPEQIVNFVPVIQKTPEGDKIEMYPETKERVFDERKEHRRMEEFERRIEAGIEADKKEKEAQNSDITTLKAEMDEMKLMLTQIIEHITPKPEETDLNKIHWKKFQKMAKGIGETWTTKDPRGPIIEKLNHV